MTHTFASDCHNHSDRSPDGKDTVPAMLARAKELGLYAYTLTDHCECNAYQREYCARTRAAWMAMCITRPVEGVRFYRGLELGQPMQDLPGAEEAVARFHYDFIIGSLHNLRGEKDFYYMEAADMPLEQLHTLLARYWDELLEMIDWGGFDSLGHLTYPLRYIQGEHGVFMDLERHAGKIQEVFSALVEKGIALEVNTSGLRQGLGETMPGLELLKRYYAQGGRLVTLGSDAHCTEDLGKGIDEGMELLKAAGFREFAVYEKRKPVLLPLE